MFERYRELKTENENLAKRQKSLKAEIRKLEVVAENIEKAIGESMMEKENMERNHLEKNGKEQER